MFEEIKAIFFDSDNTLVDHKGCEKQALQYLFNGIGEQFKTEYQDIFRPLDRKLWDDVAFNKSIVPKEEIPEYRFKVFFEKIDIKYNDYKNANVLFQSGLASSISLIENAHEVVEYLYNKNYKLFIVTNGLIKLQKPRVLNSSISKFIIDVIVSEEVDGIRKPDPKIFNTLLQRYNFKPNDVIMIGDSLEKDIKGAQNANLRTIWYNPFRKDNFTEIKPDYEINSLLDLKELL